MEKILAKRYINMAVACIAVALCACSGGARVPDDARDVAFGPSILPDYRDVVIPPNIAPLNFCVDNDSVTDCVAVFSSGDITCAFGNGRNVVIDPAAWSRLLASGSINVRLYTCVDKSWRRHPAFGISVAPDSIDRYVTYRLIPPHNTYERMCIMQRDVTSYDQTVVYSNRTLDDGRGGQCVNCHSYQNYRASRMQFHVRGLYGGTVIYDNGRLIKNNLKTSATVSTGVYQAWHPYLDVIAYSTNLPFMLSHTYGTSKSEVQDSDAGLVIYDVESNRIYPVPAEKDVMPSFPSWSPDGRWLYYCRATFKFGSHEPQPGIDPAMQRQNDVADHYSQLRYDIYRRSFDPQTKLLGDPEPVIEPSRDSLSAAVPRISPDGRYLLTSISRYGNFHIYHPGADLYITDLDALGRDSSAVYKPLEMANSNRADSYHNWSSNGRWIVFQSRRRDNNYTRLYFSWFGPDGVARKAFELPQQSPDYEFYNLNSYNLPELSLDPVPTDAAQLARFVMETEAIAPSNMKADANSGATVNHNNITNVYD